MSFSLQWRRFVPKIRLAAEIFFLPIIVTLTAANLKCNLSQMTRTIRPLFGSRVSHHWAMRSISNTDLLSRRGKIMIFGSFGHSDLSQL